MSLQILAIRHAATAWNREKRLQGRRDIPLSPEGLASLADATVPAAFTTADWYCSPLLRARQTADAIGVSDYQVEAQLVEMDWGRWEGQRLPQLRAQLGPAMAAEEARGLDLQPPAGETPRQVQQRLLRWLNTQPDTGRIGIICHKGVLRAMLSLALEWDMIAACPIKVCWQQALLFNWHPRQGLTLVDYNLPLK